MFDNNDLPNNSSQFAISHEVLALLRWLVEHHAEELKNVTKTSLQKGLHDTLFDKESTPPTIEDTQESIVNFFSLLEFILMEASEEHTSQKAKEQKLQPTIDQIDSNFCDTNTVQNSIECVTTGTKEKSDENTRDLLFKEILKRWNPHTQQTLN